MRTNIVVDSARIPERMRALGGVLKPDLSAAVFRTGALYRTRVRAKASGRPGPRAQTGDYRRSIAQTNTHESDGTPVALVHTNKPQALRLEYGFIGPDVLGRVYNYQGHPHWAPAAEGMEDVLQREALRALDFAMQKVWRS